MVRRERERERVEGLRVEKNGKKKSETLPTNFLTR